MVISTGTTAAEFAGGVFFFVNNPTLAANLPFIGHIFEKMQDSFSYEGDYSKVGKALEPESVGQQLESAENTSEMEEVSAYTKTADGLTVTLSEVYCNDQALYITTQIQSESKNTAGQPSSTMIPTTSTLTSCAATTASCVHVFHLRCIII